ncbi:E3 ubiquitin-protein ligase TRIM45-like [Amphiura filiformis]|uniref:E3 ubiquitin-protein ligase TRIM45-like n=1 Tax=Amphiura filiformis TaxID=82378 RepID=UPI003B22255F
MATASASTSGNWELLKRDLLTCPICKEFFDDNDKKARALMPCLHSFCEECLGVLIGGRTSGMFECPMCHNEISIHEEGVEWFQVDFHKQSLLDYLPDDSRNRLAANWRSQKFCTACDNHPIAESWCNVCKYLCRICSDSHKGMFVFKTHQVVELTEEVERNLEERFHEKMCGEHQQEMNKVCTTCMEPVCDLCIESFHVGNHEICSLTDAAAESRVLLENLTTAVLSQQEPLRQVRSIIGKDHTMIQKQGDASIESLHQVFEKCQSALRVQEEALASRISQPRSHFQKQLVDKRELAELKLMQMGSNYEHVSDVMDKGSDIKVVRTRKEIEPTMNEISSWVIDTKPALQLRNLRFEHQDTELQSICDKITRLGNVVDEVVTIEKIGQAFKGYTSTINMKVSDSLNNPLSVLPEFVQFQVLDPSQQIIQSTVSNVADGKVVITYKPQEAGEHTFVMFSKHDPDSKCKMVIDVHELSVAVEVINAKVYKPSTVKVTIQKVVDGRECGVESRVKCLMSSSSRESIPCEIMTFNIEDGLYTFRFIPRSHDMHILDICVGDDTIVRRQITSIIGLTAADVGITASCGLGLVNHKCVVDIEKSKQITEPLLYPRLKNPKGEMCPINIGTSSGCQSRWHFYPTIPGTYTLEVYGDLNEFYELCTLQIPVYSLNFQIYKKSAFNSVYDIIVLAVNENQEVHLVSDRHMLQLQVRNKRNQVLESSTVIDGLGWKLNFACSGPDMCKIYTRTHSSCEFVEHAEVFRILE